MGVRALAKAMAVPPLSRGHASVRSQAERARAGRSPAEAVPSSPHPLPPLRAPLGGRSRDDSAKRARLLLRKRSVRAEPLASEKEAVPVKLDELGYLLVAKARRDVP